MKGAGWLDLPFVSQQDWELKLAEPNVERATPPWQQGREFDSQGARASRSN